MLLSEIQEAIQSLVQETILSGAFRAYSGRYCEQLSYKLAAKMQAESCLLTSSGTAALEMALRAAGVAQGDRVAISAYDYPGNFWAIERVGARPVLIDTQAASWQLALAPLEQALAEVKDSCRALVISHLHGELQDVAALRRLCDGAGMRLIEDCCQAIGARQPDGSPVGHSADFAILSFGGGKTITAGRGGALLSRDGALGQRAVVASGAGSGAYQLSELQAATVLAQLDYLEPIQVATRETFARLAIELPRDHDDWTWQMPSTSVLEYTSYYQAGWIVQPTQHPSPAGPSEALDALIAELRNRGLPAGRGFAGFHRRSRRRCDIPVPLVNAPRLPDQTLLVHHRIALGGKRMR